MLFSWYAIAIRTIWSLEGPECEILTLHQGQGWSLNSCLFGERQEILDKDLFIKNRTKTVVKLLLILYEFLWISLYLSINSQLLSCPSFFPLIYFLACTILSWSDLNFKKEGSTHHETSHVKFTTWSVKCVFNLVFLALFLSIKCSTAERGIEISGLLNHFINKKRADNYKN